MAASKAVALLQYVPLRLVVGLLDLLPVRAALAFARGAGALAWALLPGRRRVAVANVKLAGVAKDDADARRIARASFDSFAMLAVESLKASKLITPDTAERYAEFVAPPETFALFRDPGQPIILGSAHVGNWELSGHIASFFKPLVAVARNLDNPYAQRFMKKRNPRRRIEIVAKHSQDRMALLRPLRSGKLLGLICDQHAASHGVMVPFFGHPASTVTSPARLALATGVPVVCGFCVRTGPMKFRMEGTAPIWPKPTGDRDADVVALTTEINRRIEDIVRRYPEQYLWSHRRWRKPRAAPAESPATASPSAPAGA
ncbi:MAG: hypothetical protein II839_10320 [Kiritimatiellae bacterium]|nr:hypothetical protein [Kiritimatiellia bacterium]